MKSKITLIALLFFSNSLFSAGIYTPSPEEKQQMNEVVQKWIANEIASSQWYISKPGSKYKGKDFVFVKVGNLDPIRCGTLGTGNLKCGAKSKVTLKVENEEFDLDINIRIVRNDTEFKIDDAGGDPHRYLSDMGIEKKSSMKKSFLYDIKLKSSSSDNSYSDKSMKIIFSFPSVLDGIHFELENMSKTEIKIDWNESNFIDTDQNAGNVTHNGVKFIDANSSKPQTIIPPGSKITDSIVPTNRISLIKSWYVSPLFPLESASGNVAIDKPLNMGDGSLLKGKKFTLWLAFIINGKLQKKEFPFVISSVQEKSE